MNGGFMYKIIPADKEKHPNARVSPDGTEMVLSTSKGDMTRDEALRYISENWGHLHTEKS